MPGVPLNARLMPNCACGNPVPTLVTGMPTTPSGGTNPVITGAAPHGIEKLAASTVLEPFETSMGPDKAPPGTVATSVVSSRVVIVAATPLGVGPVNRTPIIAGAPNPVPRMVTLVPRLPHRGLTLMTSSWDVGCVSIPVRLPTASYEYTVVAAPG